MNENQQQSRLIVILKQIWPYVYRIINAIFYFIMNLIKTFFKYGVRMIKGEY